MKPPAPPVIPSDVAPPPPGADAEMRDYIRGWMLEQGLTPAQAEAELDPAMPLASLRAAAIYVYRARMSTWELERLIAQRRRMRFATRALPLLAVFAIVWSFVGPVLPDSVVICGALIGLAASARIAWKAARA